MLICLCSGELKILRFDVEIAPSRRSDRSGRSATYVAFAFAIRRNPGEDRLAGLCLIEKPTVATDALPLSEPTVKPHEEGSATSGSRPATSASDTGFTSSSAVPRLVRGCCESRSLLVNW